MDWMSENADYVAAAGSAVIGILGALVSIEHFVGLRRWGWALVFLGLGFVSAAASFVSISNGKSSQAELVKIQKQIEEGVSGGDNFCFFEPVIENPSDLQGPIRLRLVNHGIVPLRNLRFFISPYWVGGDSINHREEYYSLMKRDKPIDCPVESFIPDKLIKPGSYRIEFSALNARGGKNGWYQTLIIEQSYNRLVAVWNVHRNGKVYPSPLPQGYFQWWR